MKRDLYYAKAGSERELTKCLECSSEDLVPINYSANECLNCSYQQSKVIYSQVKFDRAKLRELK